MAAMEARWPTLDFVFRVWGLGSGFYGFKMFDLGRVSVWRFVPYGQGFHVLRTEVRFTDFGRRVIGLELKVFGRAHGKGGLQGCTVL